MKIKSTLLAASLLLSGAAHSAAVIDNGANNSFATAQSINGYFTLDYSADIGGTSYSNTSTSIPHATVYGLGNDAIDFYSFSISQTSTATFDIDYAQTREYGYFDPYGYLDPANPGFDSWIEIYDANGYMLGMNDNYSSYGGAEGSLHSRDDRSEASTDSLIQMKLVAGTYVVGVGRNSYSSGGMSNIPTGAVYQLQVLTSVPAPAAAWLLGSGLLGLIGVARHKAA